MFVLDNFESHFVKEYLVHCEPNEPYMPINETTHKTLNTGNQVISAF